MLSALKLGKNLEIKKNTNMLSTNFALKGQTNKPKEVGLMSAY